MPTIRKITRSKFARRIIGLFAACALLPFILLTVLIFNQVTAGMEEQYGKRMQDMVKTVGMTIYERLQLMDATLQVISANLNAGQPFSSGSGRNEADRYANWFTGIAQLTPSGQLKRLYGKMAEPPPIPVAGSVRDEGGKTMILTDHDPDGSRIFMVTRIDPASPAKGYLAAQINTTFLWGIGYTKTIPLQSNLCVLDQNHNVLINSLASTTELLTGMAQLHRDNQVIRYFSFRQNQEDYVAGYWPIFMRSCFNAPDWVVILSQDKDSLLKPLNQFKRNFPLLILLSIWVVMLLGMTYIRRSLIPLQRLQAGTVRVARGDFDTQVEVAGNDEFADLARSFNQMAGQLSRQISTLKNMGDIDRAILSSLDTRAIVITSLERIRDFLDCRMAAIGIIGEEEDRELTYYLPAPEQPGTTLELRARIDPEEVGRLLTGETVTIEKGEPAPAYLTALTTSQEATYQVTPLIYRERLVGILALSYAAGERAGRRGDGNRARHLAAQMSVALANSHLMMEHEKLSWGAIHALGRSVDAKSSWTAGHSERVTRYALQIARALELPEARLQVLHRAALLHDIGKLGIPRTILDKPAKLSADEYDQIRTHPALGARILEPITAFREIIPIIIQHHERYDGTGYPHGLRGEEIILEARILTVADVFDALFSVRPYRRQWNREKIVAFLEENSGVIFDPGIIASFLELLARDEITISPLALVE